MASSPRWPATVAERLTEVLGPVGTVAEIGGGYAAAALGGGVWRAVAGGRTVLVKTGRGVTDEAAGLDRLRQQLGLAGGSPAGGLRRAAMAPGQGVPEVLLAEEDLLVTGWVDAGERSEAAEERLGAGLARLHAAAWDMWGGGSSWIGACPVDPAAAPDAAAFYGRRLMSLAGRCGLAAAVEPVARRMAELIPPEGPVVVHGDLWWGNVVWGADDRPWLIDPSVHGGHPEEDLAMLALFGPVPPRALAAYQSVRPLAGGWQDRVALWQLYPLLVHNVLFGGGYRMQALAAAHRYA